MRAYAYFRVDKLSGGKNIYTSYVLDFGYEIPSKRIILEEVEAGISLKHRNKFINLINYAMESGDLLLINGIDSLGGNFNEIFSSVNLIFKKRIRLICLEFSKNEIVGDVKNLFIHFLKLSSNFEDKSIFYKKSAVKKLNIRAGRPEILNNKQKKEVLDMFKTGHSISSIAKYYSVSRTVIQRLISKSTDVIHGGKK